MLSYLIAQTMKKLYLFSFLLAVFLAGGSHVSAQTQQCQPIYGGGESCAQAEELRINKSVKNPQDGKYVNSLSVNDPKYAASQSISFRIEVQNISKKALSKITLRDILPQYVVYVSGTGNFDAKNKTLTFTVDKLNPNETKVFFVEGKTVNRDSYPKDQGTVCVVNQAIATFDKKSSQDNSQFCIQKDAVPLQEQAPADPSQSKGGLPVYPPSTTTTTPPTGPEALALFGLLPAGALGIWLRRKGR